MNHNLLPCITQTNQERQGQGIASKVMIKTIRRRNKQSSITGNIRGERSIIPFIQISKGIDTTLLCKEHKRSKIILRKDPQNKEKNDQLTDKLFKFEENQYGKMRIDIEAKVSPRKKINFQTFLDKKKEGIKRENTTHLESLEESIGQEVSFDQSCQKEELKKATINSERATSNISHCLTPVMLSSANIIKKGNSIAHDTKNGYDIERNVKKINQDRLIIRPSILKLDGFCCYAVFDGHGQNGHFIAELASQYMLNYFSDSLKYFISRNESNRGKISSLKGLINEAEIYSKLCNRNYSMIKTCIKETQAKINESEFEIDFSGCTCCCLLQINHHFICANIGDSRAILVKSSREIILLSNDHKPIIVKEKKRIEESGGEVKKMHSNIGPHRVWVKDRNYPGIAMSRSLGDKIAKAIGVSSEPDIIDHTIDENNDRYVVIASDGLWDHLSNEKVEEIVTPCYLKNDSRLAVNLLIEASSLGYISKKENIDDISIIVLFLPVAI